MLQTTTIFTNVSKGILAKEKDLMEAFGTTDEKAICLEILKKGDLQVRMKTWIEGQRGRPDYCVPY